jgi:uncharacterized OsmC-like protein
MNEVEVKSLNGVNVDQLVGTIEAIKGDPEIAQFKFRSQTKWINGGHCQTKIQSFYGGKQEDTSRVAPMTMEGDEPGILLGEDHGPNAVEAVLHALASCLSVGIVYNAAAMGIEVYSLNFNLEGSIDLHAFLGLSETMRAGYENITVKVEANTSASAEQMQDLLDYVTRTSPVLDIIRNPVTVNLELV